MVRAETHPLAFSLWNTHTHTHTHTPQWGQVWESSAEPRGHARHHCPPWCLFVHPSSSPPGAQRVNVYSGLGLQPSCLEPPGSRVRMPFLAGQRAPWRASPAPDPHREEGAPQCLPCQKPHHHHPYPSNPPSLWHRMSHLPLSPLPPPPPSIITVFIRV